MLGGGGGGGGVAANDGGGGGGAVHCSCSIAQRGIVCSRGLCSPRSYYYYGSRRETRKRGARGWETLPTYDDDHDHDEDEKSRIVTGSCSSLARYDFQVRNAIFISL